MGLKSSLMLHDRPLRYRARPAPALEKYALENLRYIRETMERSASFTAVPGWGGAGMGATALLAAGIAARQATAASWLAVWMAEALIAVSLGLWTLVRKARAAKAPVFSGAGRRFALSLCPPLLAGAVLTVVLYRAGLVSVLPGLWLTLYGAGVATGGAFSVKVVPLMGLSMMVVGTVSLFGPPGWGIGLWERVSGSRTSFAERSLPGGTVARLNTLWREGEQQLRAGRRERGKARNRPAAPQPTESMDLDRLIHEKMRLGIVSALAVNDSLSFNDLKKLLDASDGNLSVHARRLEEADYIHCTKSFAGRLPKTEYRLTGAGRKALEKYLDQMETLIRATRGR